METVLSLPLAEWQACPSEFSSAWGADSWKNELETWLCVVSDLYHALAHPAVTLPPATDGEKGLRRPSQYLPSPEEERAPLREKKYYFISS